jgi:hypothetical protein
MAASTKDRPGTRWERVWREAGNPPRPEVSKRGTPEDVAARQFAALVASGRPRG